VDNQWSKVSNLDVGLYNVEDSITRAVSNRRKRGKERKGQERKGEERNPPSGNP
jgi:hypothetical protein